MKWFRKLLNIWRPISIGPVSTIILQSLYEEPDAREILLKLAKAPFVAYSRNTDQIWASILLLSDGVTTKFEEILVIASEDWRDVVVGAGLAVDGWQQRAISKVADRKPR